MTGTGWIIIVHLTGGMIIPDAPGRITEVSDGMIIFGSRRITVQTTVKGSKGIIITFRTGSRRTGEWNVRFPTEMLSQVAVNPEITGLKDLMITTTLAVTERQEQTTTGASVHHSKWKEGRNHDHSPCKWNAGRIPGHSHSKWKGDKHNRSSAALKEEAMKVTAGSGMAVMVEVMVMPGAREDFKS
jgi:hypothetical protein